MLCWEQEPAAKGAAALKRAKPAAGGAGAGAGEGAEEAGTDWAAAAAAGKVSVFCLGSACWYCVSGLHPLRCLLLCLLCLHVICIPITWCCIALCVASIVHGASAERVPRQPGPEGFGQEAGTGGPGAGPLWHRVTSQAS